MEQEKLQFDFFGIKASFPASSRAFVVHDLTQIAQSLFNNADFNPQIHRSKTFVDGSQYVGEISEGLANGRGIRLFRNGDLYLGNFKKDLCDGYGHYVIASGYVYCGFFTGDKLSTYINSGKKRLTLPTGECVESEEFYEFIPRSFPLTQYHLGRGTNPTLRLDDITIGEVLKTVEYDTPLDGHYSGQINEIGEFHGKGKKTWSDDGTFYEGDWYRNEMHGFGKKTFDSGSYYEGEFQHDSYCGHGEYHSDDGWHTEGEYKNNKLNGKGKYYFSSGTVYEGEFQSDCFNGHGVMRYKNGDVYDGEWLDDKHSGQGTYKFFGGDVYVGGWYDGDYNGQGRYTSTEGWVYEGGYSEGKRVGRGTLRLAGGDVYEGDWRDDQYEGQGKLTFANGDVYEGGFSMDERHGYGVLENAKTNEREEGFYNNGVAHGFFKITNHANNMVRLHLFYQGKIIDTMHNYKSQIDVRNYEKITITPESRLEEFVPLTKCAEVSDFARDFSLFMAKLKNPDDFEIPLSQRTMDWAVKEFDAFVEIAKTLRKQVTDNTSRLDGLEGSVKFIGILLGLDDLEVKTMLKYCEGDIYQWTTEMILYHFFDWEKRAPNSKFFAGALLWAYYCDTYHKTHQNELWWFAHFNSWSKVSPERHPEKIIFASEGQAITILYCLRACYGDVMSPCDKSPLWTDRDNIAKYMEFKYGSKFLGYKQGDLVLHSNGFVYDVKGERYLGKTNK